MSFLSGLVVGVGLTLIVLAIVVILIGSKER